MRRAPISVESVGVEPEPLRIAPLTGLGDFTADWRLLFIGALSICTGVIGVGLAIVLLDLIKLWTNIFFFQRLSLADVAPGDAHVGLWVIPVAVTGAMIVGLMARFGSDRIRGHGIPEAIEVILLQGSRVRPRVAVLKPVSAAISIGSGGPFGAEGPIIMTGGACGSLFAQLIHLSDAERKTLMVSGAAAGMSAIFATPMAAVLLAVELLLFEWKPRSLVPVAIASITAYTLRWYAIGHGPIFPLETTSEFGGPAVFLSAIFVGVTAGCVGATLTQLVYLSEDSFGRLPFHWMWWPALGGLVIGVGGYFFPRTLGVGYGTIGETLNGELALKVVLGLLIVKSLIWSISLGSGTSGGVLAPLLMIGASLGAVESHVLPEGAAFWAAIGMAAVMGGTMRAPLTAVIFAVELTHDLNLLVPLLIAVAASYAFTVLTMKRSILTEKISRRGFHLSSEYSVDPLELQLVRDAMQPSIRRIDASAAAADLEAALQENEAGPFVVGERPVSADALRAVLAGELRWAAVVEGLDGAVAAVAYTHEPLRLVAHLMASTGVTRLPVLDTASSQPCGVITLEHLLSARARSDAAETQRARHMWIAVPGFGRGNGRTEGAGVP